MPTAELHSGAAWLVDRHIHEGRGHGIALRCEEVAAFKRPRRVFVTEALPKTASGKIQRLALRPTLEQSQ